MEINKLQHMERESQEFGSSEIGPKRLIMYEQLKVKMCFLNPDPHDNS